jgi:hypothetical protein
MTGTRTKHVDINNGRDGVPAVRTNGGHYGNSIIG